MKNVTKSTKKNRPGPPNKVSDRVERADIKRRYVSGEPLPAIAADYDVSTATVRKVAVDEGAKPRTVGRPKAKQ